MKEHIPVRLEIKAGTFHPCEGVHPGQLIAMGHMHMHRHLVVQWEHNTISISGAPSLLHIP